MNPYLDRLKTQKPIPQPLTELPEATSVSFVSASGRLFSEIDMPCVSSVSDRGSPFSEIDMVCEFMEIDGLSLEEARALAAVSIPPRPAAEWLAMIDELHRLITRYAEVYRLADDATARIIGSAKRQPASTIPASIEFFQQSIKGRP